MSTADISTPVVIAKDGLIHVVDWNLDHNRLHEIVAEWGFRQSEADEDHQAKRYDRWGRWTKPAAQSAAEDVWNAAGLTLTVDMARVLVDRLNQHIDAVEQAS